MSTLAPPRAGRREWIGLAVLALPTILVALDMSVLYLALPHVATSLGASDIQQLWITDSYGFVLAGLLVTIAHPFASMLVTLAGVRRHLGAGPADPAVSRVRDAYLEVWSDLMPHRELVGEQELACWVGKVARALTWDRALRTQGHDQAGEFADAPRQHLTALLADSWSDLGKGG